MRARSWFAIALLLGAIDVALATAVFAVKAPTRPPSTPSPIRVPSDEELQLWDRPHTEAFGPVTLGEWTYACQRLANDFRTGRITIDEALVFAVGGLRGIDWASGSRNSSGTATT